MEPDIHEIGRRVRERRNELHLTQLDIKAKTGISSGNISDIERGNRLPAAATLIQLSEALECSIDYMLTGRPPVKRAAELSEIGESAQKLLKLYEKLSEDDQEELLMIAQLKADKQKRKQGAGLFPLRNGSQDSETA